MYDGPEGTANDQSAAHLFPDAGRRKGNGSAGDGHRRTFLDFLTLDREPYPDSRRAQLYKVPGKGIRATRSSASGRRRASCCSDSRIASPETSRPEDRQANPTTRGLTAPIRRR